MRWFRGLLAVGLVLGGSATGARAENAAEPKAGEWTSLFNGKDLDGWTPKIKGSEFGDNYKNTFRSEDGVIKVSYDEYDKFQGEFGHLFYKQPFSKYKLRLEYRFTGEQCPGGPGWANRNSGIMLHCQDPKAMRKDQDFPVSIECQFLGGFETGERATASVCSPGTHIVMDGKLITQHCNGSTSKTHRGDQWVKLEVEVHGNGKIKHFINGDLVMEYEKPQLDPGDPDGAKLIEARGGEKMISEGYISLQAESSPVEFRNIEVMLLED